MPESWRGGKNWDYRFGWIRDAAFTVEALIRFGLREEPHAAVAWLLRAIQRHGPRLHIFYALDGSLPGGVQERCVPGWRGIGPVVAGNRANGQMQFGIFGDLMKLMRVYVQAGNLLDAGTAQLLRTLADEVLGLWRQEDSGIWELPQTRHYTSSKMGCWQALIEAVRLHEMGAIDGPVAQWRAEADTIRAWVREHCWSPQQRSYTAWAGGTALDASVLLHAGSGFATWR
ncbi:glycoside hydrolase family 15 protein [Melaminivora jejuensis]|nr:glycoside hydrolase family 15 protein [Melaminivora jejuensis]UHJ66587.1 glycoside hydrolase family 15 protein [Melaminivora jejuensis]